MTSPPRDPDHWLFRLSAAEWLAAADHELDLSEQALGRRAVRPGVTHARRAAGMAWNAVLVLQPASLDRYGRSYMDHLVAIAVDETLPGEVRTAAQALRDTPAAPPALVTLGKPSLAAAEAARRLIAHARTRVVNLG